MRLIIAGVSGVEHVGRHLRAAAARRPELELRFFDTSEAYRGPLLIRKIKWHLHGKRPAALYPFSEQVLNACLAGADCLLSTGIAPLTRETLVRARDAGVSTVNFLTDDPWNPAHHAKWFLDALPEYHAVFTPRRANIKDLQNAGCRYVEFLPFAYAPDMHTPSDTPQGNCDVFFAGGADRDRLPWISALMDANLDVALYGRYWGRYRPTRRLARGIAPATRLNRLAASARVCLCLVRRANRDGHVMRSFELAAMKSCMLVERTDEHIEMFGADRESVVYFDSKQEMVQKAKALLSNPAERTRLANAVYQRITAGRHTYAHRLTRVLALVRDRAPHPMCPVLA